jgi:hypothetical protein
MLEPEPARASHEEGSAHSTELIDVDQDDGLGITPLWLALLGENHRFECAEILLATGADPMRGFRCSDGTIFTALEAACVSPSDLEPAVQIVVRILETLDDDALRGEMLDRCLALCIRQNDGIGKPRPLFKELLAMHARLRERESFAPPALGEVSGRPHASLTLGEVSGRPHASLTLGEVSGRSPASLTLGDLFYLAIDNQAEILLLELLYATPARDLAHILAGNRALWNVLARGREEEVGAPSAAKELVGAPSAAKELDDGPDAKEMGSFGQAGRVVPAWARTARVFQNRDRTVQVGMLSRVLYHLGTEHALLLDFLPRLYVYGVSTFAPPATLSAILAFARQRVVPMPFTRVHRPIVPPLDYWMCDWKSEVDVQALPKLWHLVDGNLACVVKNTSGSAFFPLGVPSSSDLYAAVSLPTPFLPGALATQLKRWAKRAGESKMDRKTAYEEAREEVRSMMEFEGSPSEAPKARAKEFEGTPSEAPKARAKEFEGTPSEAKEFEGTPSEAKEFAEARGTSVGGESRGQISFASPGVPSTFRVDLAILFAKTVADLELELAADLVWDETCARCASSSSPASAEELIAARMLGLFQLSHPERIVAAAHLGFCGTNDDRADRHVHFAERFVSELRPFQGVHGDAAMVTLMFLAARSIDDWNRTGLSTRRLCTILRKWSASQRDSLTPSPPYPLMDRRFLSVLLRAERSATVVSRIPSRFGTRAASESFFATLLHAVHVPFFRWISVVHLEFGKYRRDITARVVSDLLHVWLRRRIVFRPLLDREPYRNAQPLPDSFLASPLRLLPRHCLVDIHAYAAPTLYLGAWNIRDE